MSEWPLASAKENGVGEKEEWCGCSIKKGGKRDSFLIEELDFFSLLGAANAAGNDFRCNEKQKKWE